MNAPKSAAPREGETHETDNVGMAETSSERIAQAPNSNVETSAVVSPDMSAAPREGDSMTAELPDNRAITEEEKWLKAKKFWNERNPVCFEQSFVAQLLTEHAADLRGEVARLREQVRWIPVEERLPENDHTVLVYLPRYGSVWSGYYDRKPNRWRMLGETIAKSDDVTHWTPLPDSPDARVALESTPQEEK